MPLVAKIVLPVDFSDRSRVAAQHAGALARRFRAQVILVHVKNNSVFRTPEATPRSLESQLSKQNQLDEFGGTELEGAVVKRLVCSGDPARVIVELAHSEQADLIVMPTRGCGPFRRFLLGSVTAKILHDAECPVWTGAHLEQHPAFDPTEVNHVMCAVDFGPQSMKALRWAAGYAGEFGAKLTLAHAVFPSEIPERYAFQWHEENILGAMERLHALLRESCIDAIPLIVHGDAPKALRAAAQESGAGLLVIGRRPASSSFGRLGRDAYGIVCHSPCPVVSI